jgi:3-hydroxybutyryl-CoA dehydrogenase
MRMVEEGIAGPEDIDRALELGYGHRMGPLKTSDLVGLDVRLAIAETLSAELPSDRFQPPEILRSLVAEGHTGRKSGEGFYRWDADKASGPGARAAELARKR